MNKESKQTFTSNNRSKIVILLFFILGAVGFYYSDKILNFINDEKGLQVASVTDINRDVKKKKGKSLDFKKAKRNDAILNGDSIFTGNDSKATVTFKTGHVLTINQNSLITFDEMSGLPEFVNGDIKLQINETMKIKINNEIVNLKGSNSIVQLYKEKDTKKIKVMLLKGSVSTMVGQKETKLVRNVETNINEPSQVQPRAQEVPVQQKVNYRLYDVYAQTESRNSNLKLKPDYVKNNYVFEKFKQSQISISPAPSSLIENRFGFKISDEMTDVKYVVEISPYQDFHSDSQYFYSGAQFERNFERPGSYYVRYRKVFLNQVLSENSPEQELKVIEKPVVVEKPAVIEKPVAHTKSIKKMSPVKVVERKPAVAIEAAPVVPPVVVPEKVKEEFNQSKLQLPVFSTNQNYKASHIGLLGSQAYLASGQQIRNGTAYPQNYNLGIDIRHWRNQHGYKASVDRAVVTKNTTNQTMSIGLGYLYRFKQSWGAVDGGRFQYYLSGGVENYTNSNATSEYLSSYDLYKFGLGASMPIFKFWVVEGEAYYGLGSKIDSALLFSGRTSYSVTNDLSIGLGFRARKINYKLLNIDTSESLSETFTTFQKQY